MIPFKTLLCPCLTSLLFWGCNRAKEKTTDPTLSGHFINETFLAAIPDSIPGLVPAYCYELNFTNDSVQVFFGFEEATFAYEKEGDSYRIRKAMQDQDMPFKVNNDETITLVDTAWTKSPTASSFRKTSKGDRQKWRFEHDLNQQMIAGNYTLYKNGQSTPQKVSFQPDGTVSGLDPYTTYTLCYSGDCVGEIDPISNNITLTTPGKQSTMYAFVKNIEQKKITIHPIEAPIKDMKGERAIKGVAFDLRQP
jgi:hypothetical protein